MACDINQWIDSRRCGRWIQFYWCICLMATRKKWTPSCGFKNCYGSLNNVCLRKALYISLSISFFPGFPSGNFTWHRRYQNCFKYWKSWIREDKSWRANIDTFSSRVSIYVPQSSSILQQFFAWFSGRRPELIDPTILASGGGRERKIHVPSSIPCLLGITQSIRVSL